MLPRYENQKFNQGYTLVLGCDEVGRGSLAGPVVAAAVALPQFKNSKLKIKNFKDIKDSKLLTPEKREKLADFIKENFLWSIGEVPSEIVDKINIHHATLLAMKRAMEQILIPDLVEGSKFVPSTGSGNKFFLYIDGKFTIPGINIEQEAVVGGDNKILSVAAASIIAKVYRDNLMRQYHKKYPAYNFAQHKGYGTLFHRTMILRHGLCKLHRLTFCS